MLAKKLITVVKNFKFLYFLPKRPPRGFEGPGIDGDGTGRLSKGFPLGIGNPVGRVTGSPLGIGKPVGSVMGNPVGIGRPVGRGGSTGPLPLSSGFEASGIPIST